MKVRSNKGLLNKELLKYSSSFITSNITNNITKNLKKIINILKKVYK